MKKKLIAFLFFTLALSSCTPMNDNQGQGGSGGQTDQGGTGGQGEDQGGGGQGEDQGGGGQGEDQGGGTPTLTDKQVFCAAKKATFESTTYQYSYSLEAKIKYKDSVNYSPANISGVVQWNKNGTETQYMSKRELSGLLLFDSTSYTYNKGNDLIRISADEEKDFSSVDSEKITANYDFENNSVGCLLKRLEENDNLVVKKDTEGKYNLSLKTNFAQDSFLKVLNYIDSTKIINALNKLTVSKWGVGFEVNCYATPNSDTSKVKTFHFDVNINVKDTVSILFAFDQEFTSYAGDISIQIPEFKNTFVSNSDIANELNLLSTLFDENKKHYYKYDLKTAVDHGVSKENPLGMAVNSHSQGYAERSYINDEVYFHNGLELDSDYKNKDQYPNICDDYKFTRAKVNNDDKEVYDVKDGVLKNTYNLIENYNNDEVDDYYMLISKDWLSTDMVKILRKTENKDNTVTYKMGIGEEGVRKILNHYNKHIRLSSDPTKEHINVFTIKSGLNTKKADYKITTTSEGNIASIDILLKGFYEMDTNDDVKFSLNLKIRFDYSKTEYEIPTQKKDIALPNYDVIG